MLVGASRVHYCTFLIQHTHKLGKTEIREAYFVLLLEQYFSLMIELVELFYVKNMYEFDVYVVDNKVDPYRVISQIKIPSSFVVKLDDNRFHVMKPEETVHDRLQK